MSMLHNLSNQRILVTRAAHQNRHQIEKLQTLGAEPVAFPLINIKPIAQSDFLFQDIKDKILNLDRYDGVIFTSPNAALHGAECIHNYWPQLPVGIFWIAIGKQTQKALKDRQICAWTQASGHTSETLVAHLKQQNITFKRLLIIRGDTGRDHLQAHFQANGTKVDSLVVYYRDIPRYPEERVRHIFSDLTLSALLLTSCESLNAIQSLISQYNIHLSQNWFTIPIIVPSDRVATHAQSQGYTHIIIANSPDDESMIQAIPSNKNKALNNKEYERYDR